jgi:hypothetical protein
MPHDLRRHMRSGAAAKVVLSWADSIGVAHVVRGTCLNISETGMRIEAPDPMKPREYVTFRVDELQFKGWASVRYCRRDGMRYRIGLEFSGGLQYDPPPDNVNSPHEAS